MTATSCFVSMYAIQTNVFLTSKHSEWNLLLEHYSYVIFVGFFPRLRFSARVSVLLVPKFNVSLIYHLVHQFFRAVATGLVGPVLTGPLSGSVHLCALTTGHATSQSQLAARTYHVDRLYDQLPTA